MANDNGQLHACQHPIVPSVLPLSAPIQVVTTLTLALSIPNPKPNLPTLLSTLAASHPAELLSQ